MLRIGDPKTKGTVFVRNQFGVPSHLDLPGEKKKDAAD